MKKNSGSMIYSSPGTPEYYLQETPKYWSSERATNNTKTRTTLMPSAKNLPSKWEDAERWITSPISGPIAPPRRRHKSKSGPLAPAELVYLSSYSPARKSPGTSVPGISDSRDHKKLDEARVPYYRDMTTQMSPERSCPTVLPIINLKISDKDDVRDVEVDKGTTTAKPSGLRKPTKDEAHIHSPWNGSELSQIQRQEAKITAWENLQKAKAETKIRQLEMKLERKRSASMDRILNKLRAAQMKAQATRNLLSKENRVPRLGFSCCSCVDTCTLNNSYVRRGN